jgi:transposase-like protein
VIGSGKPFSRTGESPLKKHYQIDKERALQKFRSVASNSQEAIQLALPVKEAAALVQQGLMHLAIATFTQIAEQMMRWEVDQMVGPKQKANPLREALRWGSQKGYCVIAGQKVPLQRPRVRDVRRREVPLGSYESLQRASLMEDAVWQKIMHGLTTRRYSAIVRELKEAYGIEKSTVSEHFVEASRGRLQKVETRPLDRCHFCALLLDGTCFDKQQILVALGLTLQGEKMILGVRQAATENSTVVKHLLEDLQQRASILRCPGCMCSTVAKLCILPCARWPATVL